MFRLEQLASNMTEVTIGDKMILFSYRTPVAYHEVGKGYFRTNKKWSVTTSKHINKWIGSTWEYVDQSVLDEMVISEAKAC